MKVVLPAWIVESASQGRLLSWQDYRYLHEKTAQGQQNLLSFTTKNLPRGIEKKRSPSIPADSNPAGAMALNNAGLRNEASIFAPYAADPSNLNAQKALADPEWRRAHTSAAPDFVEGYYRNSRLHYLSTWKAELRALIAEAQEQLECAPQAASIASDSGHTADINGLPPKSGVSMRDPDIEQMRFPPRNANHAETSPGKTVPLDPFKSIRVQNDDSRRVIMHCDFDCFFVSVGLTTRPHLRGKPVVVSHSQGKQGGMSSTSEVASASYEAREKGVRNGMRCELHF
jgi:DNA repair protein REV1